MRARWSLHEIQWNWRSFSSSPMFEGLNMSVNASGAQRAFTSLRKHTTLHGVSFRKWKSRIENSMVRIFTWIFFVLFRELKQQLNSHQAKPPTHFGVGKCKKLFLYIFRLGISSSIRYSCFSKHKVSEAPGWLGNLLLEKIVVFCIQLWSRRWKSSFPQF